MSVAEDIVAPLQPLFPFKPELHYRDWLRRQQAKESFLVPDAVITAVTTDMANWNILPANNLATMQAVRTIFKQRNLLNYHPHIPQILLRGFGIRPVVIDPVMENELMRRYSILRDIGAGPFDYDFLTIKLLHSSLATGGEQLLVHCMNLIVIRGDQDNVANMEQRLAPFFDALLWQGGRVFDDPLWPPRVDEKKMRWKKSQQTKRESRGHVNKWWWKIKGKGIYSTNIASS